MSKGQAQAEDAETLTVYGQHSNVILEKIKKITCLQFFSSHENPSCTDESWRDETCLLNISVVAM